MMRTAHHEGRDWVLLAGGGPEGTRYAVADLIHWRIERDGAGLRLPHIYTQLNDSQFESALENMA